MGNFDLKFVTKSIQVHNNTYLIESLSFLLSDLTADDKIDLTV
jgi:hypothetical protein